MEKQAIIEYCQSIGLDTIGFIPCRRFGELVEFFEKRQADNLQNEFEEKDIERRVNPNLSMESGKTIISIAFPYLHTDTADNGFSVYTKRLDYHRVVKQYLNQIISLIESLGGKAECFVDSNPLPERYIAYLAGVGFIGRNNMIITKKYGSYVFLGEIITDLIIDCKDLRTYDELALHAECKECGNCLKECPTKSINKVKINPNICLSYLTQKKELTDKEMGLLKGNVFGCDFCQLRCPYNDDVIMNHLAEFATLDYMNDGIEQIAGMDNKFFKEKIASTSCGWRGKNVIKRNALIRLSKEAKDLSNYEGDSPYINEYIKRLHAIRSKKEEKTN